MELNVILLAPPEPTVVVARDTKPLVGNKCPDICEAYMPIEDDILGYVPNGNPRVCSEFTKSDGGILCASLWGS